MQAEESESPTCTHLEQPSTLQLPDFFLAESLPTHTLRGVG